MSSALQKPAAPLWPACTPGETAAPLFDETDSVDQLLARLEQAGGWAEALRLLGHAVPRPAAIQWAVECAELDQQAGTAEQAALRAARRWLDAPAEETRRACLAAAQAAGFGTAAGSAALAVFWSGGSISPTDAPPIEPADHLCAHAAACAVQLSGIRQPERAVEHYRQCLTLGRALAGSVT